MFYNFPKCIWYLVKALFLGKADFLAEVVEYLSQASKFYDEMDLYSPPPKKVIKIIKCQVLPTTKRPPMYFDLSDYE